MRLSRKGKQRRRNWLRGLWDEAEMFDPNPKMAAVCKRLAAIAPENWDDHPDWHVLRAWERQIDATDS